MSKKCIRLVEIHNFKHALHTKQKHQGILFIVPRLHIVVFERPVFNANSDCGFLSCVVPSSFDGMQVGELLILLNIIKLNGVILPW